MKSITVVELAERSNTPLIDVRERDEYARGHAAGVAISRPCAIHSPVPPSTFVTS